MNEILQLKGRFEQGNSKNKPGASNIPKNQHVSVEHLYKLKKDLINVRRFWKNEKLKINPLISAYYKDVVAKSNRIKGMLESGIKRNNNSIVGSKFSKKYPKKHIITHCVTDKILEEAIKKLESIINIIEENFGEKITYKDIEEINKNKFDYLFKNNQDIDIKKSRFVNIIVDSYYLENLGIEQDTSDLTENSIITIYDTGIRTIDIMKQLNINFLEVRSIDETTILLTPDQYSILKTKAPYLISMAVSDISTLEKEDIISKSDISISIPKPINEPTIGVIDTMFDENVYFSEWVKFENKLDESIELNSEDYRHGTMVSSIIVDGPSLNPELDDGCGSKKWIF